MIVQKQHLAKTDCTMLGSGSSFSALQGLILAAPTPAICPVQTVGDTHCRRPILLEGAQQGWREMPRKKESPLHVSRGRG